MRLVQLSALEVVVDVVVVVAVDGEVIHRYVAEPHGVFVFI